MKIIQKFLSVFSKEDGRGWYFFIIPIYYLGFYIEESLITENYFSTYMPLDDKIPFIPELVVPYQLWLPALVVAGLYFFFKDVQAYKKYMVMIALTFFSTLFIYAIFPNGQDLRPERVEGSGIFVFLVRTLYALDTNTNVCPSLHVIGAINIGIAIFDCKSLKNVWIRILSVIVLTVIALSTVFVKQHSVWDIILAIPVSALYAIPVYRYNFPLKLWDNPEIAVKSEK